MTDPTLDTMTIRERLARALIDEDPTMSGYHETHIAVKLPKVDAILAALKEPTEGMKAAAMQLESVKALDGVVQTAFVHGIRLPEGQPPLWQAYQAMIQHIQEGGK